MGEVGGEGGERGGRRGWGKGVTGISRIQVQQALDDHSSVYVFQVHNQRNSKLKDARSLWPNSRLVGRGGGGVCVCVNLLTLTRDDARG